MIAMPDPGTFAALPWRPAEQGVARLICDIQTPERTPYEGDPRYVLKRALQAVIAEATRLYKAGVPVENAVKQANFGEYSSWTLAAGQAPIAMRKVYEELSGQLK